jgi:hypothetical protein
MKVATLILTLATIGASVAQARDIELVEGAYEVSLDAVTLPGSTAGTVSFRTCASCDSVGLRVDGATVYQIGDLTFQLSDFLESTDDIRGSEGGNSGSLVAIYYDLDSNQVTRISVYPPRA